MKFLKDKFRYLREKNRWTVVSLAKELKVSKVTVHSWQNGSGRPSDEKIAQLARLFNVPKSELCEVYSQNEAVAGNSKESILLKISKFEDTELSRLLKLINKKVEENTLIANIIPKLSPVPVYIKDDKLKYVFTSKAFERLYSLSDKCNIRGITDFDLFSKNEALANSREDEMVLKNLKPVINREGMIPGLRGRWGLISKFPMLDEKNVVVGVAGMIVDITDRRKSEMLRVILEDCLKVGSDISLWIGRGINSQPPYLIKKLLYVLKPGFKEGERDLSISLEKEMQHFYSLLVDDKRKNIDLRYVTGSKPLEIRYEIRKGLDSNEVFKVREIIRYDSAYDVYYGLIINVTEQDLIFKNIQMSNTCALEQILKEYDIPKDKIKQIIDKFTGLISSTKIQDILETKSF